MSAALTSHASLPPIWEAFSRTFRKLRTQLITACRLFMSAALSSRASSPPMWEASNARKPCSTLISFECHRFAQPVFTFARELCSRVQLERAVIF